MEPTNFSEANDEPSKMNVQVGPNLVGSSSSVQTSPSVRGKKGLARTRALNSFRKSAADFSNKISTQKNQT